MKKNKKIGLLAPIGLTLTALPIVASACTTFSPSISDHDKLIAKLKNVVDANGQWTNVDYAATPYKNYHVYLRNPDLKKYLTSKHTRADMSSLQTKLKNVTTYKVTEYNTAKYGKQYFIPAAQISSEGAASYTSIWVRDSVWNILALLKEGRTDDANKCTKSLFRYFRTENQIKRVNNVIDNFYILLEKNGAMNGLHIRFDAHTLEDVQENGKDQYWSHKQNDALGLYISLFVDFARKYINDETVWPAADKAEDMKMLVRIIAYLNYIEFYDMEDSGAWEEIEKVACSSVACVTAGLEAVRDITDSTSEKYDAAFATAYENARQSFDSGSTRDDWIQKCSDPSPTGTAGIYKGIERAYIKTIVPSVEKGGESIRYPKSAEEYREGDAALLNLIYPYALKDTTITYVEEEETKTIKFDALSRYKILEIVENNNNDYGVLRYKDDNYQCSDYWFANIPADVSEESHRKRKELYLDGSEASWFFDSWMAICYAEVILEAEKLDSAIWATRIEWMRNKMHYHINKAIAFVNKVGAYRSDGSKTTEASLPESYTVVTADRNDNPNRWYRLASAVDPLRWAQSSMTLMLDYFINSDVLDKY